MMHLLKALLPVWHGGGNRDVVGWNHTIERMQLECCELLAIHFELMIRSSCGGKASLQMH